MNTIDFYEEGNLLDRITIAEALKQLTTKQRATLALRAAGYTQAECGIIFGMERASIGFIERRARLRLREALLEVNDGDGAA